MVALDRRTLLTGAAAAVLGRGRAFAAPSDWQSVAPAEAGFADDLGAKLDELITERGANIYGVVVVRRGRIALERYHAAFTAERAHGIRSVTKSIMGLLYGIALAEGKVPPPDEPLLAQFPQYADLPDMAQRRRWTIRHAITMTLGTEWDEDLPYSDPRNGHTAMEAAPDRYRYVLEQPIVAAAGERWTYCSGATALLGKILENGTRQSLHDYARAVLFDPLGIVLTGWHLGGDGERDFAGGLVMRPRDLARIGQMLVDGGRVGERQLVPAAWLAASFKPAVQARGVRHYGYHWYVGELAFSTATGQRSENWIAAAGYGGQRLVVFPELELVVVITAGNFDRQTRSPSEDVISEVVLPSIR